MITRRRVVLAGGISLIAAHSPSQGQPAAPLRRVGWLSIGSSSGIADVYGAFKQGMRDLGWVEGKNVAYYITYADGDATRLESLARELIKQNVDVVVVGNASATRVVQRATRTIPIVMGSVNNPLGNGFVATLAKPGGNITGIATQGEVVLGKLIGILHEIAPGARRIAFLLNEDNPNFAVFWAASQSACAALGLDAMRVVATAPAQIGAAVDEIVRLRSQAVVIAADPVFLNERANLQALMQAVRLPVAYGWREHVVAGGLLSYAADINATFRHVASYVDKILKGAKPADLPVEQANEFELVINLKTAKSLGLTIPQSLLLRADEVIS